MSRGRYDPPDPKCSHKPTGIVSAGDVAHACASTYVCARPECIADAMEWARSMIHLPASYRPFPVATQLPQGTDAQT